MVPVGLQMPIRLCSARPRPRGGAPPLLWLYQSERGDCRLRRKILRERGWGGGSGGGAPAGSFVVTPQAPAAAAALASVSPARTLAASSGAAPFPKVRAGNHLHAREGRVEVVGF